MSLAAAVSHGLSTGDGIACLAAALVVANCAWALAWLAVRSQAIRAEALRRLGEHAWTAKTTTKPDRRKPA